MYMCRILLFAMLFAAGVYLAVTHASYNSDMKNTLQANTTFCDWLLKDKYASCKYLICASLFFFLASLVLIVKLCIGFLFIAVVKLDRFAKKTEVKINKWRKKGFLGCAMVVVFTFLYHLMDMMWLNVVRILRKAIFWSKIILATLFITAGVVLVATLYDNENDKKDTSKGHPSLCHWLNNHASCNYLQWAYIFCFVAAVTVLTEAVVVNGL
ncbi:uncharacterized protein LOC124436642 isoform X2 [Xenia sp. Carnegie-2017]|nr:uncharacterized protein LOC124436642 isoform X2 [Xenia sp. Carnegie-2017]XP_046842573.1 uncharacterized protein LOC124436642 isoform X2 [Xenia sp. Carnegie-2017]